MLPPLDTCQEVDNKLERAIYLTQQLEKNDKVVAELKEILIFLRGLNGDVDD